MYGILKFKLPEEQEEFEAAAKGIHYKYQVGEIWNVFFRGRHKHGYADHKINELLGIGEEEKETEAYKACNELMDRLEILFKSKYCV